MTGKGSGINYRKIFFYAAEVTFAVISGMSESTIYQAYSPDDFAAFIAANARAIITQIAIVLFSVAFVEASQIRSKGKAIAMVSIGLLNLAFAFVAFWFIRESSLIYAHQAFLAPAQNQPLIVGDWVLNGAQIDPLLVAALPLFQVAMSWVGPLVVREHAPESAEEMTARQQRELAEMEHKQKKMALRAKGLRSTIQAAIQTETPEETPDNSTDAAQETADQITQTGEKKVVQFGGKGIPKGYWKPSDFAKHVLDAHGVKLSDDAAKSAVQFIGRGKKAAAAGSPFIARESALKKYAREQYSLESANEA